MSSPSRPSSVTPLGTIGDENATLSGTSVAPDDGQLAMPSSQSVATASVALLDGQSATSCSTASVPQTSPLPLKDLAAVELQTQLTLAFHTISSLQSDVHSLVTELIATKQQLAYMHTRVSELDALVRDAEVKATRTCKVSDGELSGIKEKVNNIEHCMTNLSSARRTQGQSIRDIRRQVNKIASAIAPAPRYQPTTTARRCPPAGSKPTKTPLSGSSSGNTSDYAPIPVLTSVRDTRDQLSTSRPDQFTGHAHPPRRRSPDQFPDHAHLPHHRSPGEKLSVRRILPDTTHLIIGDSLLRPMKSRKMSTSPLDRVQIISVSGMKAVELLEWLSSQPVAPNVERMTIHVGVNDCKGGEVTSRQWKILLTECQKTFPGARLQASSIITTKRESRLGQTITMTNANLCYACRKLGVTLIDNSTSFTQHGRPILALT